MEINKELVFSSISIKILSQLTNEIEEKLKLEKDHQPEKVYNIFKFCYILVNKDYSGIEKGNIISTFYSYLNDIGVSGLNDLFLNNINKKLIVSPSQIEKINDIVDLNRNIFNKVDLYKTHKAFSYFVGVLKEIYDYINRKLFINDDELYYIEVKSRNIQVKEMKEEIERLKTCVI